MTVTIQPSTLKGTIRAPASKSSMQRALAAALLAKGSSVLHNPGHSNDDKAAMDIIQKLGARVVLENDRIIIHSEGVKPVSAEINCGESGLSIRMFTPIAALSDKPVTITGEGSLLSRPMDFFDDILPLLGVKIESNRGKLPLHIQGPLLPRQITVDGSLSSQFLTGLLMAFSAANAENLSLKVKDLKSKPYISLTLEVMRQFGMKTPTHNQFEEFFFQEETIKPPSTGSREYTVEGDWSGAAFLLVAGTMAGPITVRGLDLSSSQADKAIVDALMAAGAGIAMEAKGIKLHPSALYAFEFDATDCPDLFPPLVTLAAYCGGQSRITGVNRLTHKESNRSLTLKEEFGKMGIAIDLEDDLMIIHGGKGLNGARLHSHHDHRIAMACTVAALKATGETILEEAEAVKKSYPDFYSDLRSLGASVSLPFQHFNS
ncbi:MAG TPA: 3-phosphoshikimate 1-carboxyvinyltransferase [Chitinophagaceae bacterium]|nr:3-phosphoshikimate 1-carboxyvinyltransferase [Chitinophagaceae bacterium]